MDGSEAAGSTAEPDVLDATAGQEPTPTSSSALSEAPSTVTAGIETGQNVSSNYSPTSPPMIKAEAPAQVEDTSQTINSDFSYATNAGVPRLEAAQEQVAKDMSTSAQFTTPLQRGSATPRRGDRGNRGGRSATRTGSLGHESPNGDDTIVIKMADGSTPGSSGRGKRRGRGRGGGRPRGRGRGGGRGGKRKRDDDDDDDGDSDSSDEVTPAATMTKSGRSVQKPTSFVPPPPSPTTASNKRKRPYNRRNPESAVCKICLRGTSPASNMIVFCDGCNTPYHRWCHKPPIDQAVIDEVERDWFCGQCERERLVPVPEAEVASFVSAEGTSELARQKYFASLPPGMLVTLLTKVTTLKPDLPLFDPEFKAKAHKDASETRPQRPALTNGHHSAPTPPAKVLPPSQPHFSQSRMQYENTAALTHPSWDEEEEEGYGSDVHPSHYPRPGQGLMRTLPPEQDELQRLVDDDDKFSVFTHLYRSEADAGPAPASTSSCGKVKAGFENV